jgi:RecG-like helicase
LDFGLCRHARITRAVPPVPSITLSSPVRELAGVGPERAAQLARLEIFTVGDLLLHRPNRYEDRRHFITIAALELKQPATVRGTIVAQGLKTFKKGARSVFEFVLDDGTEPAVHGKIFPRGRRGDGLRQAELRAPAHH